MYSSILLIFNSHGDKDTFCFKNKSKSIATSELWQWCKDNPSICKQPVVAIIEVCSKTMIHIIFIYKI
jgi:hypothetical protein